MFKFSYLANGDIKCLPTIERFTEVSQVDSKDVERLNLSNELSSINNNILQLQSQLSQLDDQLNSITLQRSDISNKILNEKNRVMDIEIKMSRL